MPFTASIEFSGFRKKSGVVVTPTLSVNYLLVGGGGGGGGAGGNAFPAGGGGAGGYRTGTMTVVYTTALSLVVGTGGNGGAATANGSPGNATSYNGISAAGGGYGARTQTGQGGAGGPGGSGGGGSRANAGGAGNTPAVTPSQGNNGGAGANPNGGAGGGGGAGGVGGSGGATAGGAGGVGATYLGVVYAAGGAGGTDTNNTTTVAGVAGAAATGNGGGGAGGSSGGSGAAGGAGGSGIAILSYAGLPRSNQGTISTDGVGNTIHKFTTATTYSVAMSTTQYINNSLTYYYKYAYFNDDVTFFNTGATGPVADAGTIDTVVSSGVALSFMWVGYFLAPTTGTYTFSTASDDSSLLWIGANAVTGYTVANATVNNSGAHVLQTRSGSVSLTANTYYAIRIMYGNSTGSGSFALSWTLPSGTTVTDGTGYLYYNTLTGQI